MSHVSMDSPSSTTLLSEDDLLQTYGNGDGPEQTVDQFRLAHELRQADPNRTRASIAREVGRPASAVRRWLVDGSKPREIQAIETAEQYEWLPLRTDDRLFESFNLLLAWAYAGGWINPDTFQPSFTVNHQLHRAVASHVLDPLGNDWQSIHESNNERTHELRPRDGGAVLGRLLTALGAPQGSKAEQTVSLPDYLDNVEPYHRRQFARMYLLHRGAPANAEGVGLTVQETRGLSYFRELQDFFEGVTNTAVSLNESLPKLHLPTDAVQTLAGGTSDPKQGLVYRLIYGDDGTLVSERAFVNTYGASYRNPWTVVHQYREAMSRYEDPGDDVSQSQLARDVGVSRSKIRSWIDGGKPYAVNGLDTGVDRGWVGIEPAGKTFLQLNRLVAWLFAAGNLNTSNHHPRFLFRGDHQQAVLEAVLDELDVEYKIQESGQTPEVHPRADGAVLGRVLRVMGAPVDRSGSNSLLSLPVYIRTAPKPVQQDFLLTYLLNRRKRGVPDSEETIIFQPEYSGGYLDELAEFIQMVSGGPARRETDSIRIPDETIRSMVPDYNATEPDESFAAALGFEN